MSTLTSRLEAMRTVLRDCDYDFIVKDDYIIVENNKTTLINEVIKSAGELGYQIRLNTDNNYVLARSVFE